MTILLIYLVIFVAAMAAYSFVARRQHHSTDYTSLKTVTFGDESAVTANRFASIVSVITIFLIWGSFTGSALLPKFLHVPGPFTGATEFTYQATDASGQTDDGKVLVTVFGADEPGSAPDLGADAQDGFANDIATKVQAYRSALISASDALDQDAKGARITGINGNAVAPGETVAVANGVVRLSEKGSMGFEPDKGWQMEHIWLPAPEGVFKRFIEISKEGYQNTALWEHLGWSLWRVLAGFFFGSLIGIPLGYAMGLNSWFRGWFDTIVEFMRPVPPLALIPLIIIWFGIWETGKISLLFLAALWIMVIAARSGVSGVRISKVHAAYSLGASKWQLLTRVIVPNSLPDIFTGARVAMGVCWGTVVAAELVAAEKGAGKMIIAASKFQSTDIVIMGIILIGVIGYGIDIAMRVAEKWLIPWKGKG